MIDESLYKNIYKLFDNKLNTFITISFKSIYSEFTVRSDETGIQINSPRDREMILNLDGEREEHKENQMDVNTRSCDKENVSNKDLTIVLKLDLNETITLNSTHLSFIEFPEPAYKEITAKYKKMKFLKQVKDECGWCKLFKIINNGDSDTIFLCEESDIEKYKSLMGNKTVGNTMGLLLNRDIDLQYNEALETYRRHTKEKQEV